MTDLSLKAFGIGGPLPTSLALLTTVTSLDLSFNAFTGPISNQLVLGFNVAMKNLDLGDNQLVGQLPTSLSVFNRMTALSLSLNKLSGNLPTFLSSLSSLVTLDVKGNLFSGKVPQELCSLYLPPQNATVIITANSFSCYEICWSQLPSAFMDLNLLPCAPSSVPTRSPSSRPSTVPSAAPSSIPTIAPSSEPTMQPSIAPSSPTAAPTSFPTLLRVTASAQTAPLYDGAIAGIVIGVVVFFCLIFVALGCHRLQTKAMIEHTKKKYSLRQLPIHKALYKDNPITRELIMNYISTANEKDFDQRTVLDLILDRKSKSEIELGVLFLLVENCLPFDTNTLELHEDPDTHNFGWAKLVQRDDKRSVELVELVLMKYKRQINLLAYTVHPGGRACIDVASAKCQALISRRLYLHERYELNSSWEHRSPTCEVWIATYHHVDGAASANMDAVMLMSVHGISLKTKLTTGSRVALKFMKHKDQFLREIDAREMGCFDSKYVIGIVCSYDCDITDDNNIRFREDATLKGFLDYPYCIVMEAADQNLTRLVQRSTIAGNDWDEIRRILKQILLAVDHMHGKGFIHGDLKPPNVMMVGRVLKLIDLDASASLADGQYSGAKYSTLYSPPELLYEKPDGTVGVRTFFTELRTNRLVGSYPYDLLKAHPSHDMWAVGVVLYFLCTGGQMFSSDASDNVVDTEELSKVWEWSDRMKAKKVSNVREVSNPQIGIQRRSSNVSHSDIAHARHLLSLLLYKDPAKRPSATHVLDHPFISGKSPARMQGDKAEFDIFLSYRVDSDSKHVEKLYDGLTAAGLRVWWDKKCLAAGKNWEEGFCDGLVKSAYFVCLLSRGAINNAEKSWQNFSKLEKTSKCDNVLLEWRLTLELKDRGMIEGIFPVFIGDDDGSGVYSDYFASGCHPGSLMEDSVDMVEEKLLEHLDRQALGQPYRSGYNSAVKPTVDEVISNQGSLWEGEEATAVQETVTKIRQMVQSSPRSFKDEVLFALDSDCDGSETSRLSDIPDLRRTASATSAREEINYADTLLTSASGSRFTMLQRTALSGHKLLESETPGYREKFTGHNKGQKGGRMASITQFFGFNLDDDSL